MILRKFTLSILCSLVILTSCKKDDESTGPTFVEADRTEQQIIDNDLLVNYLETHYYNSALFATPGNYGTSDIIITELPQDEDGNYLPLPNPDENTLLIDVVETHETTYLDVAYEYYILRLNQGGGNSPHFSDNVRLNYSGMLENAEVIDSAVTPTQFDLLNLIQGWRLVMSQFNAAESFEPNGDNDGTFNFDNYGLGVMFLPSGLAYYSSPLIGIPLYSNLIFKFALFQTEINDHERASATVASPDSVPSYLEDLNGDKNLLNDDTDADRIPNFLDVDDDNDGVLTKNEVEIAIYTIDTTIGEEEPVLQENEFVRSRVNNAGVITLKTVILVDSNTNGTPDYLESAVAIDLNE